MSAHEMVMWLPEGLTCEFLSEPVGIGTARPWLSWRLPEAAGAVAQSSFELRVAASPDPISDDTAWASGETGSSTMGTRYAGPELESRQRCWWCVRVRTDAGALSQWSRPTLFETGLLLRSDWTARFVRRPDGEQRGSDRAPYALRRRFELPGLPTRARAYVTALGVYELYANGERVSDALLRPGWTDARYRVQVEVVELTSVLRSGENVIAALVAPGWYSGRIATRVEQGSAVRARPPELLVQLELALEGGSTVTIGTDESWQWAPSAILSSDLYDGEDWDLRLGNVLDWSDASTWSAVDVGTGTAGELVGPRAEPIRAVASARASVSFREDGSALIDSGANDTGFLRLQVRTERGRSIEVAYGEILEPSGALHRDNLRGARCIDTFICAGDGLETLAPSFSYRGYQYAVVRGLPEPSELVAAEAVTIASDLRRTGWFHSSSRFLEQLYGLMVCSLRANYVDVPTDCPQRDERMGWMADALLFAPVAAYTYDISAFMSKWFDDILDARTPDGGFSDVAPRPCSRWWGSSPIAGAPAWADAGVLLPWLVYERYGNPEPLERMFPAMRRWLALVHGANPNGIWHHGRGNDYGDWVPAGPDTSHDLFATAWLYCSSMAAASVARLLRDEESAAWLDERALAVRSAFAERYVDAKTGRVGDPLRPGGSRAANRFAPIVAEETQTGYVMALVSGLLEPDVAARAGERLAELVRAAGNRLETGFSGSALLLGALELAGHPGLAYELLLRREPPSLGFMLEMGATSVWERWNGLDRDGWPGCPTMNSFNHYAMSSMLSWLVEGVCGLRPVAGVPALGEIAFRPAVSRRVGDARFELDAPAGRLELGWSFVGDDLVRGTLTLPPGMRCSIAASVSVDDEPGGASAEGFSGARVVGGGEHEVLWRLRA